MKHPKNLIRSLPGCLGRLVCALLFFHGATMAQSMPDKTACLQKGALDIQRPSLLLVTCWESEASVNETAQQMREACIDKMQPMKVEAALVPLCPREAQGICVGSKSGSSTGNETRTDIYHYTPQSYDDWQKSIKACRQAGGEWRGKGLSRSFF
jgi:hypothetical protein